MSEPTVVEMIRQYGKDMDMAGRFAALKSPAAQVYRKKAGQLLAEIVLRIPTK